MPPLSTRERDLACASHRIAPVVPTVSPGIPASAPFPSPQPKGASCVILPYFRRQREATCTLLRRRPRM